MLADLRGIVEELEEQVESVGEDATMWEEKYEAAETRAEEAECELTAWCVDLACIHMKLKAGRIDEAKDDLDWLLQKVDSDGRYRMSAVISKHPVLPGI
jgi:hypothetical protein